MRVLVPSACSLPERTPSSRSLSCEPRSSSWRSRDDPLGPYNSILSSTNVNSENCGGHIVSIVLAFQCIVSQKGTLVEDDVGKFCVALLRHSSPVVPSSWRSLRVGNEAKRSAMLCSLLANKPRLHPPVLHTTAREGWQNRSYGNGLTLAFDGYSDTLHACTVSSCRTGTCWDRQGDESFNSR